MPDETTESEPTKKNKNERKVRDITPKNDVRGGAPEGKKEEKPAPRRTGEVDFMKYLKHVE